MTTYPENSGQLNAEGRTVAELAELTPGELAKQWQGEADEAIREAGWRPIRNDDAGIA